jgi:hypothetical protein
LINRSACSRPSRLRAPRRIQPALDLSADLVEPVELDPFVVAEVLDDHPIAANPDEVAL